MKPPVEQEPASTEVLPSAWDPLRRPVFRLLWGTWLTANICMWMNEVASAWLMTTLTTSPVMIALVQSASVLPVVLFGLPSGALADILNRRRWFMFTQFWVAANALILCAVLAADLMTAPLLLALTFGNGIGLAMRWPVYAAIVPELVPRRELATAIALNGIAMNTSRIVGPVIAGALIASLGTGYVYLLNAALSLAAGFVIMRWRLEPKASVLPGERFFGAMRVGFQYVAQSPMMRAVLLRIAIFFLQSTALLALLPLVAKRMPDGGAWVYTWLLASLGFGAIATAVFLPRLRVLITRDRLLRDGTLLQAFAMVAAGFAPNVWSRDAGDDAGRRRLVSGGQYDNGGLAAVASGLGTRARHVDLHDDDDGGHVGQRRGMGAGRELDWSAVDVRGGSGDRNCAVAIGRALAHNPGRGAGPNAGANSERACACIPGRASNGASDGDGRLSDRPGSRGGVRRVNARKPRESAADRRACRGGCFTTRANPVITSSISSTNRGPIICGDSIGLRQPTPICASGAMRFISAPSRRR